MNPVKGKSKKKSSKKKGAGGESCMRPQETYRLTNAPAEMVAAPPVPSRSKILAKKAASSSSSSSESTSQELRAAISLKNELSQAGELDAASSTVLEKQIRALKREWLASNVGASPPPPTALAVTAKERRCTPAYRNNPHALLPTTNMAFEAIDGMQEFDSDNGPGIDPDVGYLLFGSSRRSATSPLEPYCSFCTLAHLILRKIGMPLRVVLIEIGPGFERPEWVRRHTRIVGCEKCDVPTLLYRGGVYGTDKTEEIIGKLPDWFPFESRSMCAAPEHLSQGFVDALTPQLFMETLSRLKSGRASAAAAAAPPPRPSPRLPPHYAPFFYTLDGTVYEPPPFRPELVYLIYGSVRRAPPLPLEPVCSYCTYIAMALTKMGIPFSIILVELDVERPAWLKQRSGCEKPDVPTLFYKSRVFGTTFPTSFQPSRRCRRSWLFPPTSPKGGGTSMVY